MQTFGLLKFLYLVILRLLLNQTGIHASMCRKANLLTLVVVGESAALLQGSKQGVQDS